MHSWGYNKVIPQAVLVQSKSNTYHIASQNSSLRDFIKRLNRNRTYALLCKKGIRSAPHLHLKIL